MKKILIIDTRAGNLFSLKAAVERLGFKAVILDKPNDDDIHGIDGIIIPGQGRFGTVMKNIQANGWASYLENKRLQNIPMLGICVGMQIFFEASEEDENVAGLCWFSGKVKQLDFPKKPMVGWARIKSKQWPDACVYFVNSFAVKSSKQSIATTLYGETFCAAIKQDSFTGVQFHPEKSGQTGSQIILDALSNEGGAT